MLRAADKLLFLGQRLDRIFPILRPAVLPVPGAIAWFDASDTDSILVSPASSAAAWLDKSGSGYHAFQVTDASKPRTGTRSHNGRNVLDFDGGDSMLSSCPMDDRTSTAFVVAMQDGAGAFRSLIAAHNGTNGNQLRIDNDFKVSTIRSGVAVVGTLSTPATTASTAFMIVQTLTATDVTHHLNNATGETDADANAFTAGRQLQIAASNSGEFWDGFIAEIIIYGTALSTADRNLVRAYLQSKWAV